MAPNHGFVLTDANGDPVSRTYQYRKVMKPLLERKRRARINRCLDELKEIMTGTLQTECENVAKLEKADILELTVRHLHTLRQHHQLAVRPEQTYAERFRDGFTQCATEVTQFLHGVDKDPGFHLIKHLNGCIQQLDAHYPPTPTATPTPSPDKQQNAWMQHEANHVHPEEYNYRKEAASPYAPTTMSQSIDSMWRPW